jgi:hypothetical protein
MQGVATRAPVKRWGAIGLGSVVALLLMTSLPLSLVKGAGLGARPAFFLVGLAVLVEVAAVAFEKVGNAPYVNRVQAGLVLAGLAYFVVDVLISA